MNINTCRFANSDQLLTQNVYYIVSYMYMYDTPEEFIPYVGPMFTQCI